MLIDYVIFRAHSADFMCFNAARKMLAVIVGVGKMHELKASALYAKSISASI